MVTGGEYKGTEWRIVKINRKKAIEFPLESVFVKGATTDYSVGEVSAWRDDGDMKKIGSNQPVYFLEYMLDTDPIEKFYDLESVKARIEELTRTQGSLKLDQIFVYESKKETKIEVEKKTIIKGI